MKHNKQIFFCIIFIFSLAILTGCSKKKEPRISNVLQFSLNQVSQLTIAYDDENINFYEGDSDKLVIKEYMTVNKKSYFAKVIQQNDSIYISEGRKPFFKRGFLRYIEVYLPASYQQNLTVTTTDGDIDLSNINLNLSVLRIDSTSGTVKLNSATASEIYLSSTSGTLKLGSIQAKQIKLETTRGDTICDELNGNVTYTSTSGNADIKSASGFGSYKVNNSGKLNVAYTDVSGNLLFFNKNDNINLSLPKDLDFNFEATTKNGNISTNFQECVTVNGRITSGIVGNNPTAAIQVETNNGDIKVIQ